METEFDENVEGLRVTAREEEEIVDVPNTDIVEPEIDVPVEKTIEPEVLDYEPNFTYKVKDEEREFDERLRGSVTTKEAEEYIRDLYTKADGLDSYKQKLDDRDTTINEYTGKIDSLVGGYKQLKSLREEGNYRKLMTSIGLDDDAVLNYAATLLEEINMPDDQKAVVTKNREYEDRMEQMSDKLQGYETRISSFETSQNNTLINSQMAELQGYATQDSDFAKSLSDKGVDLVQEVLTHGSMITRQTGKEPSIKDAYDTVINKYKAFAPDPQAVVNDIVKNRAKTLPTVKGSKESGQVEIMTLDKLKAMSNKIR